MRFLLFRWLASYAMVSPLTAQLPPGLVAGAGYEPPGPVAAAPGQLLTVFVRGFQPVERRHVTADGKPWPTTLEGVRVTVEQTAEPRVLALPIASVSTQDNCYGLTPSACLPFMAITVQVPWRLQPNVYPIGLQRRTENFAVLRVAFQDGATEAFPLRPVTDEVHALTSCHLLVSSELASLVGQLDGACRPLATRQDGSLITAANPAEPGEAIDLYLVGLGLATAPPPPDGAPTPEQAPVEDLAADFEYASPAEAGMHVRRALPIRSATLVAGQVGIYRVRISVPERPLRLPPCTASTTAFNLTIQISRFASAGSARICVAADGGN